MEGFLQSYGEAAKTALGFFWKSGWAFVLGYFVSGMIQAFVPKKKLTQYMGKPDARSVSLSTLFGAASSSCSFAALAAARALVQKGAHFVAAVAFMFASTNLVIELGILITIFLGWQYLVAEVIGGLCLVAISTFLIRLTYPDSWMESARKRVEDDGEDISDEFDWKERIQSKEGWQLVGHKFVNDWKMAWEDILIGFTIAGFVAVLVPQSFWTTLFLADAEHLPRWLVLVENALVAPFVAASTFIGSMGNIPLATVLVGNGVLFAGVMGFIFSDLMVPPLVHVNAKYYGWKVALYIAGVMFVSVVTTALLLHGLFELMHIVPQTQKTVTQVVQFKVDYTFWLNLAFVGLAGWLVYQNRSYLRGHSMKMMSMPGGGRIKKVAVLLAILINVVGLAVFAYTQFLS